MLHLLSRQEGSQPSIEHSRHVVLPKILLSICLYCRWNPFLEGLRDTDKSITCQNFTTALKLHLHNLWQLSLPSLRPVRRRVGRAGEVSSKGFGEGMYQLSFRGSGGKFVSSSGLPTLENFGEYPHNWALILSISKDLRSDSLLPLKGASPSSAHSCHSACARSNAHGLRQPDRERTTPLTDPLSLPPAFHPVFSCWY